MKELRFETLIAVFEEMFGRGLFWTMVALALLVTAAYLYVLIRDRAMSMRKFLWAQLSMPFGAILAVIFVQQMTHSGLRDIGGPIDVIVLLGVAAFAVTIRPFGLIPAILAVVIISSFAELKFRPVSLAILCAVLCLIAWLTFRVGLGLPMAMFRWPF